MDMAIQKRPNDIISNKLKQEIVNGKIKNNFNVYNSAWMHLLEKKCDCRTSMKNCIRLNCIEHTPIIVPDA